MIRRSLGVPLAIVAAALTIVCAGGATAAPAPHAAAHRHRLPGLLVWGGIKYRLRPSTIYYTGDGSGVIGKLPSDYGPAVGKRPGFLRWKVWNDSRASAVGTVWVKSCIPSCAGSPFTRYPLTLTAARVRDGNFTRMTLHYTYQGKRVADERCVAPGTFGWGIVFHGRCD
jgi:hypothetical protein